MTVNAAVSKFTQWLVTTPPASDDREARLSFLDTTGCIIAGSNTDVFAKTLTAGVAPAIQYAVAAHALDFDDNNMESNSHPSAVIISALIGLNDIRPISFGVALDGYMAGLATIRHIGLTMGAGHYARGWHATATFGVMAAAAACGRALGLGDEKMSAALSLAASQSAGLKAQFGTDAKPLQAGFCANGGLQAALLARAGISASQSVWLSFFDLYGDGHDHIFPPPPSTLEIQLGIIARKRWSSCSYTHRAVQAALSFKIDPSQIKSGWIAGPAPFFDIISVRNPKTPNEARFSLSWCVSAALINDGLSLGSFEAAALSRQDIHALESLFELRPYAVDGPIADISPQHPDTVSVMLKSGEILEASCADVPGGDRDLLSKQQLINKFHDCMTYAGCQDVDYQMFLDADTDTPFSKLVELMTVDPQFKTHPREM